MLGIIFSQFVGAATGTFITWYLSATNPTNNEPIPPAPRLCTNMSITRDVNNLKTGCKIDDIYGYVFAYEFIGSLMLIFSWLILRNYQIGQDFANRKLETFAKCALVPVIYFSTYSLGSKESGITNAGW